MRTMRISTLLVIAALALAAREARADQRDVPAALTQTGRLFDGAERPVEGTRTMVFALYTAPVGGDPIWSESHDLVFDDGYFVVGLGGTTPLPVIDGAPVYLGINDRPAIINQNAAGAPRR